MGGIDLLANGSRYSYHLIPQQVPYRERVFECDFSDLNSLELHQGELLNYQILNRISSAYLRAREIKFIIYDSADSQTSLLSILVEDIRKAQLDRGERPSRIEKQSIEASDLFNLHFCQALIGNSDYFFDYNEHSRFVTHNVSAYIKNERLIPFPYDLQFTCVLAPHYQRHRNFSLEQEAEINASNIGRMAKRLPRQVDLSYLASSIETAAEEIQRADLTDRLRNRFSSYVDTFNKSLTSTIN
jgi:hypothetical protein